MSQANINIHINVYMTLNHCLEMKIVLSLSFLPLTTSGMIVYIPQLPNYGYHLFVTVQVWVCLHVFMNISVHMCINVWRGQKLTSSVIPQDIIHIVFLRPGLSLAWDLLIWLGGFLGICLSLSLSPGLGLLVHTITHTWLWFGCTFWGLIWGPYAFSTDTLWTELSIQL